jgi:hypothetical protein
LENQGASKRILGGSIVRVEEFFRCSKEAERSDGARNGRGSEGRKGLRIMKSHE